MDQAEAKRRLAALSKALSSETDLNVIWERFLRLADRHDFLQLGKPGKNPPLDGALSAIATRQLGSAATVDVRAIRLRKPRFWHGAGKASGTFCTFFYFEALDAGLAAFVRGPTSGRIDYYRFSLVRVPEGAAPGMGGDA